MQESRTEIEGWGVKVSNDLLDDRKQGRLVRIKGKKTVRQTLTISFTIPPNRHFKSVPPLND